MHDPHRLALEARHAGLDQKISLEAQRPLPDQSVLHDLKKQKLRLKEELGLG